MMLPILILPGSLRGVSGVMMPDSSEATAVIGLNVDPVGYSPAIARSYSGAPGASWIEANFACEMGRANTLGSKLG